VSDGGLPSQRGECCDERGELWRVDDVKKWTVTELNTCKNH
jgi:hypothetical protein